MRRTPESCSWWKDLCSSLPFSPAAAGNSNPFSGQLCPSKLVPKIPLQGDSYQSFGVHLLTQGQELTCCSATAACWFCLPHTAPQLCSVLVSKSWITPKSSGVNVTFPHWRKSHKLTVTNWETEGRASWLTCPKITLWHSEGFSADPRDSHSCFPLPTFSFEIVYVVPHRVFLKEWYVKSKIAAHLLKMQHILVKSLQQKCFVESSCIHKALTFTVDTFSGMVFWSSHWEPKKTLSTVSL